ncbi:Translation initiation factor IF-2 [Gemmata obscuriglobus]|uniref:translation initiation factor IF-2 n=1 Tax=Gemmata obscuriglobus TaxID=114 RepID=UPI00016C59C0
MSNPTSKDTKDKKVRVFNLAKELNVESKVLLDYCKELGFADIKNQLNGLEPEQADALKERVKKGPKSGPAPAPAPNAPPKNVIPPLAKPIPAIPKPLPKPAVKPAEPPAPAVQAPVAAPAPVAPAQPAAPAPTPAVVAESPKPAPAPAAPQPVAAEVKPAPAVVAEAPKPAPAPAAPQPVAPAAPPKNVIPSLGGSGMRNLNQGRPANLSPQRPAPATPPAPAAPAATTPTTVAAAPAAPVATTPATPVTPAAAPAPVAQPAPAAVEAKPAVAAEAKPVPAAEAKPAPAAPARTAPAVPPSPVAPKPNVPAAAAHQPPARPTPPPAPPGPPKNIIPTNLGQPTRPGVLDRKPAPPPPKHIAPSRTSVGQAPPPSGQRPPSGATGAPGPRPSGPGGAGGPGGPGSPRTGAGQGGPGAQNRSGPGGPAKPGGPGQSVKLTPEMIERLRAASARGQRLSINEVAKTPSAPAPGAPGRPGEPNRPGGPARTGGAPTPGAPRPVGGDEEEDEKKKTGVIGRDSRHKGRTGGGDRGRSSGGPRVDRGSVVLGPGGVEIVEQQWGSRRGPRAALMRKAMRGKVAPVKKEGKIEITLPITVRSLSEATGVKAGELIKRLMKETNQLYGNNSPVEFDTAAMIAVDNNIELVVKRQKTAEEELIEEFEQMMENVDPEKLRPRPPVVTIMGHVDHGKTSLLDKIRKSNVAAGEVGGITQVIRAWSVTHKVLNPDDPNEELLEKQITFLDTPGHEAFTKMRARGANVTDIAVIVVAATDGVMPQTEEAVNHAKAADVRIIVAINKVDAPNANVERTKRQLYNLNLLPDNMGGDIQFVETSALTGQGIDDLLTAISLEAEFNLADDLKADPDRPAFGTCLEGYMTAGEGVNATVLVQQGTLRPGDIVLCGANYGRVRTMYNDHGVAIEEAGPSTPVRITGLGGVPNADDPFYAVDELTTAAKIAEAREKKDREASLNRFQAVKDLDSLTAAKSKLKVTELKIILKAEARGSVEAIKKELEKLTHEEVTTRVLHAGIGAITESDVQLARISPDDTLVIGFNVTADDAALRLADEQGVSLREYQIIYNLVDDVKAAMEGRLKPIEEVVHLGRAVVRQTFKVGKVGTIAGCYVTSGVLERSARVRIIRSGVVVFPPAEKVVGLDSLKRFKDDAKEVREGFECGLKVSNFDDIRVDDVIEAFKIEVRARTL